MWKNLRFIHLFFKKLNNYQTKIRSQAPRYHRLNSSPIDELGDGACQSGWRIRGEQQALSHKPLAAHTGLHGNSESGHHPPGTVTLTKSVEILTNPILTKSTNEGGKGRGKKKNN